MARALIVLTDPIYNPHLWYSVMLFWAVILFGVSVNIIIGSWLPDFEGLILILHIFGFFAIVPPLVILSPYTQPS